MNYLHLTILLRVWILPSLTTLIISMKNTLNATAYLKVAGFLNYMAKMMASKFILSWKLQFCMLLWTQPCDAFLLILQSIIRGNLQYASLSALRRLPLDPGNPAFLHRAVQGWVWTYFRSIIDLIFWTFVILQVPNWIFFCLNTNIFWDGNIDDVLSSFVFIVRKNINSLLK